MSLKEATAVVVMDALNDNNGNLAYEEISSMGKEKKKKLTMELMECDDFLQRFSDAVESVVSEYMDDYAEEYGIEE